MSTKDKCILCCEDLNENDYISPCECMKIHPKCNDECIERMGTKCLICKKEFVKPKIYFAGKMSQPGRRWVGDVVEKGEGINTSRSGADVIYCVSSDSMNDIDDLCGKMNSSDFGNFSDEEEVSEENFISTDDYYNNNKPIKYVSKGKYNLVGPVLHLYGFEDEILNCSHGGIDGESFLTGTVDFTLRDSKQIDKRNKEMIDSCDVFSFTCDLTAYRSLSEWGSADEKNKILVLCENLIQNKKINDSFKENFRFNILDSLESFKRLTPCEKNLIIYSHPLLPFNTFDEYKSYLDED